MSSPSTSPDCVVVGAGPAGLMLGLLLARAGVNVIVIEKHSDFLHDFRGDTIHPSTLEVMHELDLLDDLLKLPHTEARQLHAQIDGANVTIADFSRLPVRCRFIAFMSQWDFLDFLARGARRYPNFQLVMSCEITGLIEESGRTTGVRARNNEGPTTLRTGLVIGADGRNSVVRHNAGLEVQTLTAPSEVLWIKIPRRHG